MSTIKTSTLSNTEGTKELAVNDLIDRACCRAWVNFNGTGIVAIRASFNVSSITDNNTGNYTVNFANPMPDTNYVIAGVVRDNEDDFPGVVIARRLSDVKTTYSVQINTIYAAASYDSPEVNIMVFR